MPRTRSLAWAELKFGLIAVFALVMAGILFSSGFQRTSFLDNFLFMSLFYWSSSQARPMKSPVLGPGHR